MGQQQLLLLVLGIVIVGLAVVVGINAFSENRVKSNADALVTDALRIASDVQAWALKPTQFGGGGGSAAIVNATFNEIGYPNSTVGTYSNVNGDFTLDAAVNAVCTVTSTATAPATAIAVNATNTDTANTICIFITGTNSDGIETDVVYGF